MIDDVIYAIDGQPVPSVADFQSIYLADLEGRPLEVQVWRYNNGRELGETFTFEIPADAVRERGVTVLQMDDRVSDLLDHRGYHGRGVRVTRTERGGPAEQAGLRRSDVIVEVNDRSIASMPAKRTSPRKRRLAIMAGDEVMHC